jgi:hypothetical protein
MKPNPLASAPLEDFNAMYHEDENLQNDPVTETIDFTLHLSLVAKKIPMKFTEYKISNLPSKMIQTETISISTEGLSFLSPICVPLGSLTRVWLEVPDYWSKKSRLVPFRHTEAPTYFQILCRVQQVEETGKRNQKFQLTAAIVSLDPIDEKVLRDYLGLGERNT